MAKSTTKLLQEVLQTTEQFGEEKTIELLQNFRKKNILTFVTATISTHFAIEINSLFEKTYSDRIKYALAFSIFFCKQFEAIKNEDLENYFKRSQPMLWRLEKLVTTLSENKKFDQQWIEAKKQLQPFIQEFKQKNKLS